MALIYQGAEADLYSGLWQGKKAVYKVRKPLEYRLPSLDTAIRRQRTIHEAEALEASKRAGVRSPHLFFVNVRDTTLVMEFIEGPRLKEIADGPTTGIDRWFRLLGKDVAMLHRAGIMHGDLTTANVVCGPTRLTFLDFGLSLRTGRLEDHAVDLRLLKETLVGAHSNVASMAMESVRLGYSKGLGPKRTASVFGQLRSIERRGRYARVD